MRAILTTAWGAVLSSVMLAAALRAAPPAGPPELKQVLAQEETRAVDRRSELGPLLERSPEDAAARWQAGYVQAGELWTQFESLIKPSFAEAKILEEYRRLRDAVTTAAGHVALADWCRQHDQPARERAHLLRAIALAPDADPTPLMPRLGCRLVGGQWLTPRELETWQARQRATEAALKKWEPRLSRLVRNAPRDGGRSVVSQIDDVEAVPALELLLSGQNETLASLSVEAFQRMPEYEATLALARQAAFSQWPAVRKSAMQALRTRNLEQFAPALIDLLATPVQVRNRIAYGRNGALFGDYLMARETSNQFQVAEFRRVSLVFVAPGRGSSAQQAGRVQNDTQRALLDEAFLRDRQVDLLNERTAELNRRVAQILASVSEQEATPDPKKWWQWWLDYNEQEESGPKRVVGVREDRVAVTQVAVADQAPPTQRSTPPDAPGRRCDCFVAGTPVWTESGLQAIDQIQVGDLVLTKDVETGALTWGPVLQTTVRDPRPIYTIEVGDEQLSSTGGHRYWVSGRGWLRVRDLAAGMLIHTATGASPIKSVTQREAAVTYNVVVEDAHTYFVGRTALFTHDVTLPQPTNRRVPGLAR